MFDYFLEKFKDKTNDELLNILNNKIEYRHEAVDAAIKIYNDKNNTEIPYYKKEDVVTEHDQSLDSKRFNFIISITPQDIYTLVTISFGLLALYSVISLYEDEFFIKGNGGWIKNLALCFSFPVIHIFYKYDHQKSNSYIERIQFDLIFLLILLGLEYLLTIFSDGFNFNSLNISFQTIGAMIGVFLFLFILEAVLEIIRKLFRVLRIGIL